MHNGLHPTAIGQQGHHDHDQLHGRALALEHGSTSGTKGLFAALTPIAPSLAFMDDKVARSDSASCGTRRVRATLVRRVHGLCVYLHKLQHASGL
jgi:hypothetical protein